MKNNKEVMCISKKKASTIAIGLSFIVGFVGAMVIAFLTLDAGICKGDALYIVVLVAPLLFILCSICSLCVVFYSIVDKGKKE